MRADYCRFTLEKTGAAARFLWVKQSKWFLIHMLYAYTLILCCLQHHSVSGICEKRLKICRHPVYDKDECRQLITICRFAILITWLYTAPHHVEFIFTNEVII